MYNFKVRAQSQSLKSFLTLASSKIVLRQNLPLHNLLKSENLFFYSVPVYIRLCLPGLYSRYSLIQRFQRLPDFVQILLVFIFPSFPELQGLIDMPPLPRHCLVGVVWPSLPLYSLVGVVLPSLPLYSLVGVGVLFLPLGLVILNFLLSHIRL